MNSLLSIFLLASATLHCLFAAAQNVAGPINGTACTAFGSWECDKNSLYQCTYSKDASLYWRWLWNCGNGLSCVVNSGGFVGCNLGTSSTSTFSATTTTTAMTTTPVTTSKTSSSSSTAVSTSTTFSSTYTTNSSATTSSSSLSFSTTFSPSGTTTTTTSSSTSSTVPTSCRTFGAWSCGANETLQQCGYIGNGELAWRWISRCPTGQYCNANGANGWAGCQLEKVTL